MKNVKVAINGFGRIGRLVFRLLVEREGIDLVAINDLADNATLAHLLKYDSVHGRFNGTIDHADHHLTVNGKLIHALAIKSPEELPWKEYEIDVVLECTGLFRDREGASRHLLAGAKQVIISAPAKGHDVKTIVLGVNEQIISKDDTVLSNASCTTNCLAPMVKVLHEKFGIDKGFVTTVHSYTADQRLHDAPHSDLRRARAAAQNIVPTTTNAGSALGEVMPELKGRIHSTAVRVPVIDGSLTELNCLLNRDVTIEEVNQAFKDAANGALNGILENTDDELVSTDIIGNPHSCIFDSKLTHTAGNFIKITGWYDNEFGYSSRLADLVDYLQKLS